MRAGVVLALAFVLLGGCSGPSSSDGVEGGQDGSDSSAMTGSEAPMMAPVRMTTVADDVDFTGTLGAGVCTLDPAGGSGMLCANLPAATAPTDDASNVLRYMHPRQATLMGGTLEVAWATDAGPGLSAQVGVFEGCDPTCVLVQPLAEGDSGGVGATVGGRFEVDVPAHQLGSGQWLGVSIAYTKLTDFVSGYPGTQVQLSGTLTFEIPE
jgi:hypothetical protein